MGLGSCKCKAGYFGNDGTTAKNVRTANTRTPLVPRFVQTAWGPSLLRLLQGRIGRATAAASRATVVRESVLIALKVMVPARMATAASTSALLACLEKPKVSQGTISVLIVHLIAFRCIPVVLTAQHVQICGSTTSQHRQGGRPGATVRQAPNSGAPTDEKSTCSNVSPLC